MSRFTGELTITQLDVDYRTWRLEQPLVYEVGDENSGHMIEVHKLFETDGASVPRIFWALLPTWGKYSRAAVVHDYLYNELREGTEPHPEAPTRQRADAIFLEAMAVCGVGLHDPLDHVGGGAAVRVPGVAGGPRNGVEDRQADPAKVAPRPELDIVRKRRARSQSSES